MDISCFTHCNRYIVVYLRSLSRPWSYNGGDKMISHEVIKIGKGYDTDIFKMFCDALRKQRKKKKVKEPKGKAEDGSYCPKVKPGQSWSHTKDTRKDDELDREDVA